MCNTISCVLIGRNDNYGGNLHERATKCINQQLELYDEVIYVDWKSIDDISLIDAISPKLKNKNKLKQIKIYKEFIGKNLPYLYNIPLVETLSRNIGIVRATADWIVSTNIDCFIVNRPEFSHLNKTSIYTARRMDVPFEQHFNSLEFLSKNYTKKPNTVIDGRAVWDPGDVWSMVVCCGDYQFAHRDVWHNIKGFEEEMIGRCYADTNIMKKATFAGFKTDVDELITLYHLNHTNSCYREPNEHMPTNDYNKFILNWQQTTNNEGWGLNGYSDLGE